MLEPRREVPTIGKSLAKSSNDWKNPGVNLQPLEPRARPLTSLLGMLLLPMFFGLLLAPAVFNLLHGHVAGASFEKVVSRTVKIVAVLVLIPMIRRSGLGPALRRAVTLGPEDRRDLARACFLGCTTMAAGYILGLIVGRPGLRVGRAVPEQEGR